MVATGAPGTYNLTIDFTYDYSYLDAASNIRWQNDATDTDYVYIRIDDGLNVNQQASVFDENNVMVGHYLYAGSTFQKVGVYVQTTTGKIGEVTVTVALSTQTKSFITLDQPSAFTSQMTAGTGIYFKYRVDVKDGTPPGRYDATVEIKYQRWYGEKNQKAIDSLSIPLEFIVDFTPLLTITSPASFTVNQGALSTNLTEVTLQNIGNTELKKIQVWIDISNYFEENGYYFDGDGGTKILLPTEDLKEKLGKGETWQVDFMGINVFKYLPAGEHRLPLGYSGYFYDDGTAGGSSDYKLTDHTTYQAIKQEQLYIKVVVSDTYHDFKIQSTSSINLGQKMDDIAVTFSVQNLEDVDVLYATVSVGTKDQTTSMPLLLNPKNTGSAYLETVELTRFYALSTMSFSVNADVSYGATAGYYNLPVVITGVNANTKSAVSVTKTMSVRVNPEPPKLVVTDVQYTPIKGGKDFTLTLKVSNMGNDTARKIFVTLLETSGNAGVDINTGFIPDIAKADATLSPFSVKISKITVPDIPAGQTVNVDYTVKADKNLVPGKDYQMYVYADYSDDLYRSWSYNSEISISVKGSMSEKPQDNSGIINPFIAGLLLVIIIFVLMVVWAKVINKPKRPSRFEEELPGEPAPREHAPPSAGMAPATVTATPVTHAAPASGGAQTFKVCPACHKSVPSSQVTCPHCGCAL